MKTMWKEIRYEIEPACESMDGGHLWSLISHSRVIIWTCAECGLVRVAKISIKNKREDNILHVHEGGSTKYMYWIMRQIAE